MFQDMPHRMSVDMMKKAVDKDEIERSCLWDFPVDHIGHNELSAESLWSKSNVDGIDIHTEIIGMRKQMRICAGAASDVQNATDASEVIMCGEWRQLPICEWRLPQPIDRA